MPEIIGFAGFSNSGKTTLIAKVAAQLQEKGYQVAVIKHDAHGHYKEAEASDSAAFMKAGADTVITVSPDAFHVSQKKASPGLEDALSLCEDADIVIVEGFKQEKHPKIAIFRTAEQREILNRIHPPPIAIATNMVYTRTDVPVFPLDDPASITAFIISRCEARQY